MTAPAVDTHGLTRRFGTFTAVDALALRVDEGEVYGLLGSNGAGKTTTIRMLTTLLPPTAGTATVAGHDVVREAREVRRSIGYVSQMVSADGALTGEENLVLSARLYGIDRARRREQIAAALAFMGLGEFAGALVKTYSGGMVRRLEIASATLHHPKVLFLDEPTVGLDPVARHAVWDKLRELVAHFGSSILLTTHDMEEAAALCGRIGLMHGGRLVVSGTPDELRASVGPEATLDQVFAHYSGPSQDTGGSFRDVVRTRTTTRRLG
jgi:ABC-2 type transport system ATP-binding protein